MLGRSPTSLFVADPEVVTSGGKFARAGFYHGDLRDLNDAGF